MPNSKSGCQKTKNSSLKRYIILNLTFILITDVFVRSAQRWNLRVFYPFYLQQCSGFKSDNLQYNRLVRWFARTNDLSTKHLMFQVLFFSSKFLAKIVSITYFYSFLKIYKNRNKHF